MEANTIKQKRGVALFGPPGYDVFGVVPAYGTTSWAPTGFGSIPWNPSTSPDIALAQVQAQATHNVALQVRIYLFDSKKETKRKRKENVAFCINKKRMCAIWKGYYIFLKALKDPSPGTPSIAYPPEVTKAIQQAKEANHNVLVAQQRVAEAKEVTVVQQKIALGKEAAAREAALRLINFWAKILGYIVR